jgi:hypothetical protein
VTDSLIETAIARDVLSTLQDAGNTVTLAHYLRLLETSFLVSGIERSTRMCETAMTGNMQW